MMDIGYEQKRPDITSSKEKGGKVYPSITLNEKQCPFIKEWKIGGVYKVEIEIVETGQRAAEDWDNVNAVHHTYDITKVGCDEGSNDEKE